MRFKKIVFVGGVWVIFVVLSLLFQVGYVMAQCVPTGYPLITNYSGLTIACGGSEDFSASGGCPPYNWTLFGGGTLVENGDGSASYTAPSSNSGCTNNAAIALTDCCRNAASIQIAVNCYGGGNA